MSENLRKYQHCLWTLDAVVQRVPADAWSNATCNEEWNAAETLGHVVWGLRRLTNACHGEPPPEPMAEGDVVGDDPVGVWDAARDGVLEALDQEGVLQRTGATPFGEMPIGQFIGLVRVDLATHAWDIGRATGTAPHIPDAMAEEFAAALAALGEALRGPGMMAAAVEVADDAPAVDRFIALTGRDPAWAA